MTRDEFIAIFAELDMELWDRESDMNRVMIDIARKIPDDNDIDWQMMHDRILAY